MCQTSCIYPEIPVHADTSVLCARKCAALDQLLAGTLLNRTSTDRVRLVGGPSRLGHLAKLPEHIHTNELMITQDRRVLACSGISEGRGPG